MGSWATETLPLSVRKELLERELKRLGFRRAQARRGAAAADPVSLQQEGQASGHPQAGGGDAGSGSHGD